MDRNILLELNRSELLTLDRALDLACETEVLCKKRCSSCEVDAIKDGVEWLKKKLKDREREGGDYEIR